MGVDKNSNERYVFLEGIRGLAALYVLCYHVLLATKFSGDLPVVPRVLTSWLSEGAFAVVVFIVLSGFLLNLPVAARGTLSGGNWGFFIRRAWRILPAYYVALLLSALLTNVIAYDWIADSQFYGHHAWSRALWPDLAAHVLMLHNLHAPLAYSFNGSLWSIATEWQIYVLFALVLVPIRARFGPFIALATGLALGALALTALMPANNRGDLWLIAAFALGAFAAEIAVGPLQDLRKTLPVRTIAVGGAIALLAWMTLWEIGYNIRMAQAIRIIAAPTAFAWILWTLDAQKELGWFRRLLESKPLQQLGAFSYSTYLIHQPIIVVADIFLRHRGIHGTPLLLIQFAVVAPLTIACGYGFYLLVERPFMRLKSMKWPKITPPGTAATAPMSPADASPGSYARLASARR